MSSSELSIPVGSLTGVALLAGRGPDVHIKVLSVGSPTAEFENRFTDAGINQTKHQIKLDVVIDIDVIMPWQTVSTQVVSEILIAETVLLGDVPQTYLNWGNTD